MLSLDLYKRTHLRNGVLTNGQVRKRQSDMIEEQTWFEDIQSRKCYIYDYFHDDNSHLNQGMDYSSTSKTPIDAKFIVTQYGTLSKDQVEYHLQLRPSQKLKFNEGDDLYYYEENFTNKYGATFPIGLYCDIPDDNGVYHKWLICSKEVGNQFIKYSILPCNYYFHWIEVQNNKRIKRKMWGVTRNQNSYNSGLWSNYVYTTIENQNMAWLPMNSITEKLYYTHSDDKNSNQRIVMSAPIDVPIVWKISKVETTQPFGLQKLTLYQDVWKPFADYIDKEDKDDIFAMYADYYSTNIEPETTEDNGSNKIQISCNTNTIKAGGSYKLLKVAIFDSSGTDITNKYLDKFSIDCWRCYLNDEDITNSDLITWLEQPSKNHIKIKFSNDRTYLADKLNIECNIETLVGKIQLEIIAL